MKVHLNTLYVATQGAYLRKKGETVCVEVERETRLRVPLHNLESLVLFGRVIVSPFLLGACAQRGVSVVLVTESGRFLGTVQGYPSGNVLLRREQYRRADSEEGACGIARTMVAAKISNARTVLVRFVRDHGDATGLIEAAIKGLASRARFACVAENLSTVRGIEGEAARLYYSVFDDLITLTEGPERDAFRFRGRTKHPPRDRVNALLSFVYTLLMSDCRCATVAVGLDDQVGFLHRDRPGRPGLALDLMEEFRPALADRLVLSLINRRQVSSRDFETKDSGAVYLSDTGRRTVIGAWQLRKKDVAMHPYLHERGSWGFFPHFQARLLARHLRGDVDAYPAFLWGT